MTRTVPESQSEFVTEPRRMPIADAWGEAAPRDGTETIHGITPNRALRTRRR
jgi:hypothetical protein